MLARIEKGEQEGKERFKKAIEMLILPEDF
jgi:hypothetical protein